MRRHTVAVLLLLFLLPCTARADSARFYSFLPDTPPRALREMAFAIPAEEACLTLTFAGDCTLGGEPERRSHPGGFAKTVAREGFGYPFSGLAELFGSDDATLVNLEGVLSDSTANRADKLFSFIGDPAYTEILTLGSVECVTLANNHTMDFGARGYRDTQNALSQAGVGYVSGETVLVIEKDGYRIGVTASAFTLTREGKERLALQLEALKALGCHALVHVMHAGQEYAGRHTPQQEETARLAVSLGADLVVGHHPHVAQDAAMVEDTPVFYSLGNCCFGGNLNPSVRDGLVLRADFRFADGGPAGMDWALYPIRITGVEVGNDYRPILLTGEAGQAAVNRLSRQTGLPADPYTKETGIWQPALPTP
jgi:poly-gamma-glutamate synthesis protein (capsule biosynthesis protein)